MNQPSFLNSLLHLKCPRCREGKLFINKSVFPLRQLTAMKEHCPKCGQPSHPKPNFYFGARYVNYIFLFVIALIIGILFALLKGFSIHDNSVFLYFTLTIIFLICIQPWEVRIAWILYLWLHVPYDPNWKNNESLKNV